MTYTPDKWEIVKYESDQGVWYKVLGSWSGGYLDGDSWRLSSGIKSIELVGDTYEVLNMSGSTYKIGKNSRGMNIIGASVYNQIVEAGEKENIKVSTIDIKDYRGDK